ncbi:MAG: ABC transporter ATP-binding protein, partial [Bacteroidota bacterium]
MSKSQVTFGWAFRQYILPRKKIVLLGLLLILIQSTISLVAPLSTKFLLDDIVPNQDLQKLYLLLLIVGVSILIRSLTSFSLTRLLSVEAQHLISLLRAEVQKKLLKLPVSYFDNHKSGELVSRVMTDVEGVRNIVGTGLVQMVGGALTSILFLGALLYINVWMTLFVLVPMAVFGLIALKAFGYIRPLFRTRGVINAEVTGRLTETLNGVRVIKGFNAEEQENKVFEKGVEKLYLNVKKSLTATAFIMSS